MQKALHQRSWRKMDSHWPAELPIRRMEGAGNLSTAHLQTAITSCTSAAPVMDGLPEDLPAPLMSKVMVVKPLAASMLAIPLRSPWHPPSTEYWCTNIRVRLLSSTPALGLKILTDNATPFASTVVKSILPLLFSPLLSSPFLSSPLLSSKFEVRSSPPYHHLCSFNSLLGGYLLSSWQSNDNKAQKKKPTTTTLNTHKSHTKHTELYPKYLGNFVCEGRAKSCRRHRRREPY